MSDYLPQEVLIKILTRLPTKSLIKFKCVSKSWNSLISSPYFISLQIHHATTSKPTSLPSNKILIRHRSVTHKREIYSVYNDDNQEFSVDKNIRIEYPFRNNALDCYRIVGSCNGVLCLSDDLLGQTGSNIVVWNPVIKRRVALPKPQWTSPNMGFHRCVLGFGFDVESSDYKVVRLAYGKGDTIPPKAEVYSLSLRNWREINVEIPRNCVLFKGSRTDVFINRNVHWMAFRREERKRNLIVRFDIGLEVFNEMPLPELLVYERPANLNVMVIRESLAICQADFHVCSVWIMSKYGNVRSWSKMFDVSLSGVLKICGFRMNGDILLMVMGRGLVSYNLETGESVDLGDSSVQYLFYVGSYVESLALLNEGEEVCEQVHSNTKNESWSESDYSDEDE